MGNYPTFKSMKKIFKEAKTQALSAPFDGNSKVKPKGQ